MALTNTLKKGSDIMLFINDSGTYKSIAHASSHTLSLSTDVEDINTKDSGVYGMKEVNKINWEIQAQHFYTNEGYDTFFDAMTYVNSDGTVGKDLQVAFGFKDYSNPGTETINMPPATDNSYWTYAYTATNPYMYTGTAIITSLEWTAEAGSKAQFSATLQGKGAISKLTYTA